MKKLVLHFNKFITILLMMLTGYQANAQISDFNLTISNDVQISDRILEFDIFLLDRDINEPFELAALQAGIIVNSGIYNEGTITVSIVAGSSQLSNLSQQPASLIWDQIKNAIKLTPRPAPGTGSGSIINQSAPGTRICRLRITNTRAFTSGSTANLTFNFTTTPYPTKVSQYISGKNTVLTCDSINTFSNASNIVLNPPVVAFKVTGGGSYCQRSDGLPVGLDNSENGVNYTLLKEGIPQVPAVAGTGAEITFGNQLSGTYTVSGFNVGDTTIMTGSAIISELPAPEAPTVDTIIHPTCELATGRVVLSGLPATGTWTITITSKGTTIEGTGTDTTITEFASGIFNFTVTGASGCTSLPSEDVLINSQPETPPKPLIISADNYLESNSVAGNQWYNSMGKIAGETGQKYTPVSNDNYYVIVTSDDGCISEASDIISFTTGLEKNGVFEGISVYPVPSSDHLFIENNTYLSSIDFEIVNSDGRGIYQSILNNTSIVDISRYTPGVYYIRFTSEGSSHIFKFIRQ
jgi:hypothetical protein